MTYRFFALLVNPRDGELLQAVWDGDVTIQDLDGKHIARARLVDGTRQTESAGYPRSDTLDAFYRSSRGKGSGFGTALYTALAVFAKWNAGKRVIEYDAKGAGIISYPPRSPDANAWWDRAASRFGLASHAEIVVRGERRQIDTYTYQSAVKAHLVVALVGPKHFESIKKVKSASDLRLVDAKALEAADFSRVPTKTLATLFLRLGREGGIEASTLKRLADEYNRGAARSNPADAMKTNLRKRLGWPRLP